MTPMSMTYHQHVMANLRREADVERRARRYARTREAPPRRRIGSLFTVRTAARQA